MKFLLLTLTIVMCQYQNSSGTVLDILASRLSELSTAVLSTISNVRNNMLKLFQPPLEPYEYTSRRRYNSFLTKQSVPRTSTKQAFVITKSPSLLTSPSPSLPTSQSTSLPTSQSTSLPTSLSTSIKENIVEFGPTVGLGLVTLTTPKMSLQHGRAMESHIVITKDGYHLTAHRIVAKREMKSNRTIILYHGLLGSSADWILLGPKKSLPYLLNDYGYDVWMVNARGNSYSRGHTCKTIDSDQYWKFSWQELGEIDLIAIIDYIRMTKKFNEASSEKIDYIGHSMGATALLVLLSTSPRYNKYLRVGILMAPIAYMTDVKGPLKNITSLGMNETNDLFKIFGTNEFVPSRVIPKDIASKYCTGPDLFCWNPLYFLTGGYHLENDWDINFKTTVLYHVPAGTSTNTILHYVQLAKNGKFHQFNDANSEYNLTQITLPIALISSDVDWLAPTTDVMKLYVKIPNPVDHHIIRGKNLSHTEFVWGLQANFLVFDKVLEYLNQVFVTIPTNNDVLNNIIP